MIALGTGHPQAAYTLADAIVTALSAPFRIGEHVVEIGASIGVALAPLHCTDAEILTQQADEALYRAKHGGRARTCLFDPSIGTRPVLFNTRLSSHGISRVALERL
jgi:predicted signal transduction protein with EAL and GGDEF domain